MNKYDKALRAFYSNSLGFDNKDVRYKQLTSLVLKERPMKVRKFPVCPRCHCDTIDVLYNTDRDYRPKRCDNCGQMLDWSGTKEKK